MHGPRRTRPPAGPLVPILVLVACLTLAGRVVRAHESGLSALDVRVGARTIAAELSLAPSDVALVAPGGDARAAASLRDVAGQAVRLSVDGEPLRLIIDGPWFENGAARVRLSGEMPASTSTQRRLVVTSEVPARMPRGHRQLLVVTVDGRVVSERLLDAQSGPVALDVESASRSAAGVAWSFLGLGLHHILSGYDHLVFLAGLLLAARTTRAAVAALTAFTAAHSLSLALVVAGGVHAPPAVVEPLIAASIAWVGLDNLLGGRHGARLVVVFGFGLIHGFGFAGALADLGVGSSAAGIALALASFNAGVEAGQLAVAAALLPLVWAIRARPRWQARFVPACSVLIVLAGGYWLIERLL
jgi:hypothetical protein